LISEGLEKIIANRGLVFAVFPGSTTFASKSR